jgi:hypothetical protein
MKKVIRKIKLQDLVVKMGDPVFRPTRHHCG